MIVVFAAIFRPKMHCLELSILCCVSFFQGVFSRRDISQNLRTILWTNFVSGPTSVTRRPYSMLRLLRNGVVCFFWRHHCPQQAQWGHIREDQGIRHSATDSCRSKWTINSGTPAGVYSGIAWHVWSINHFYSCLLIPDTSEFVYRGRVCALVTHTRPILNSVVCT